LAIGKSEKRKTTLRENFFGEGTAPGAKKLISLVQRKRPCITGSKKDDAGEGERRDPMRELKRRLVKINRYDGQKTKRRGENSSKA